MAAATRATVGVIGGAAGSVIGAMAGVVRLSLILLALAFGLGVCALHGVGIIGDARFDRIARSWCRAVIKLLGARCQYRGVDLASNRGALLVSNHISWLDTLLFRARWRVVFLAKSEIANWPAIGWLAKRAGTLFIEVGRGSEQATRDIAEALRRGHHVVLFAEGRTTDGRGVKRFQPRLLQAAIDAGAPVQPAALRYTDHRGATVTRHSFAVASLIRGIWRMVAGPSVTAEVTLFPPVAPATRDKMAREAEQQVRARVEMAEDNPSVTSAVC